MSRAALKNNYVVSIAPTDADFPAGLDYDLPTRDGTGAFIGAFWNGAAYVDTTVLPQWMQNYNTLMAQAENALAINLADIAQIDADVTAAATWLATNTGTMTTAQLSNHMRTLFQKLEDTAIRQKKSKQQTNAIIRLLRGQYDATT